VCAGFVLIGAAAAERLGPRLGGLVASMPQLAVISLIFFTLEQGPAFAAESAIWNIPGMCATIPVFLGYLVATRVVRAPRWASIAAGILFGSMGFVLGTALLGRVPLDRRSVIPFAAAACGGTAWLVRRLPDTAAFSRVTTSPLLLLTRAGASAATVLSVTSLAAWLGPKWSGLVTGFPVNSLPVMVILHAHYGRDVIRPFVKSFPVGAFGVCLFNVVASIGLVRWGLAAALALGYATDVLYLLAVTWRRRPGRTEAVSATRGR
jgi:hypothetical protein